MNYIFAAVCLRAQRETILSQRAKKHLASYLVNFNLQALFAAALRRIAKALNMCIINIIRLQNNELLGNNDIGHCKLYRCSRALQ